MNNPPEWTKKLSDEQRRSLIKYVGLVLKFNKKINLISRGPEKLSEEGLCWELVLDSCLASALLMKEKKENKVRFFKIADLGTGAGFPGLVMGILCPDQKVDLVESSQKKSYFLRVCVEVLKLTSVEVKNVRVQSLREPLTCALSKAFFPLQKRLALTRHLFKKGSVYYHMCSKKSAEDWLGLSGAEKKMWSPAFIPFPKALSNKGLLRLKKT